MPHVEVKTVIAAPRDAVYDICSDMTRFAEFMPDVQSITLVESGDGYTVTDWVTSLQGRKFAWREREEFDRDNYRIYYRQVQGDLKKMEGEWLFETTMDGTEVTLTMDFEFGLPLLEAVLNPVAIFALKKNMNGMLEAIKAKAEE